MRLDRVHLGETAKAREIIHPHAHAFTAFALLDLQPMHGLCNRR
jgi:hypothetical protein